MNRPAVGRHLFGWQDLPGVVAESATRLLDGTGKGMDLTLVLGPMKSGKSLELVSQMSPLAYSNVTHRVYQSDRHMRDDQVTSRIGGSLQTIKTHSLLPLLDDEHVEVVGVDEIHMFDVTDITALAGLLERGTRVVATGIDLDHRGELFAPVRALFELGPQTVLHRRAVCDQCRQFNAVYTQVLAGGEPFTEQPATPPRSLTTARSRTRPGAAPASCVRPEPGPDVVRRSAPVIRAQPAGSRILMRRG